MSLRLRLVASTWAAMILCLGLSAGLSVWDAAGAVRTELASAMSQATHAVQAAAMDPAAAPGRLVAEFDGNRHVVATLLDASGGAVAQSHPARAEPAVAGWFLWLVSPKLAPARIALQGGAALLLTAEPANEAGEAWAALAATGFDLLMFCLAASALILAIAGRMLRPLARMAEAFGRIGTGDFSTRVLAAGPREIVTLASGFNRMAAQLAMLSEQNGRLHEQLLRLQDEERAGIARDLHDEIGPFLFSVNVTSAAAERLVAQGRVAELPAQLAEIRESAGHVQRHVRDLLTRLRPVSAVAFGLAPALESLRLFWTARYPDVAIDVCVTAGPIEEAVAEIAYRIVQEGLSNAVRHASPSRITVRVGEDGARLTVLVRNDGERADRTGGTGFGLAGMRERVAAAGGSVQAGPCPAGWEVTARLPLPVRQDAAA